MSEDFDNGQFLADAALVTKDATTSQLLMHAGASDTHIPRPLLKRAADELTRLRSELEAAMVWKGDFVEACRQRDAVEQQNERLRMAATSLCDALRKEFGTAWLDNGQDAMDVSYRLLRAALAADQSEGKE